MPKIWFIKGSLRAIKVKKNQPLVNKSKALARSLVLLWQIVSIIFRVIAVFWTSASVLLFILLDKIHLHGSF